MLCSLAQRGTVQRRAAVVQFGPSQPSAEAAQRIAGEAAAQQQRYSGAQRRISALPTPFQPLETKTPRELRSIGWVVSKVVMVPDEVAAIAQEVALLAG